jgi:hypothetical protein
MLHGMVAVVFRRSMVPYRGLRQHAAVRVIDHASSSRLPSPDLAKDALVSDAFKSRP